jgi:hypothetical protein
MSLPTISNPLTDEEDKNETLGKHRYARPRERQLYSTNSLSLGMMAINPDIPYNFLKRERLSPWGSQLKTLRNLITLILGKYVDAPIALRLREGKGMRSVLIVEKSLPR